MGNRVRYIDVAKGIAMIAIIMGHLGFVGPNGYDSVSRLVFQFHVPLFYLLSGYFLSLRGKTTEFIKDKAKRLLLPYAYACLVMLLAFLWSETFLSRGFPGSIYSGIDKLLLAALYGAGYTSPHMPEGIIHIGAIWYLEALFIAMVEVRVFACWGKAWTPAAIIVLAVIASLSSYMIWLPFNIQSGLVAGMFVYIGLQCRKLDCLERLMSVRVAIACAAISIIAYYFNIKVSLVSGWLGYYGLGLPVALTSSILCLWIAKTISERTRILASILEFYGKYSLPILVSHLVFINLGAKYHICHLLDVSPSNKVYAINLVMQLVLTALFAYLCNYMPIARRVFYPSKEVQKKSKAL